MDFSINLWSQPWLNSSSQNSYYNSYSPRLWTWSPPSVGLIKFNLDVTIFKDQNMFGLSMFLCNDNGTFIKAMTEHYPRSPQSHEA
ncbi:hypothetical protein JHK87_012339 [Glycine soja]|nr:hypothetical protein JHK87_012339 [Glycine soja]KAG5057452.1 hypothetical protein JHK86_012448 [Glycine max]